MCPDPSGASSDVFRVGGRHDPQTEERISSLPLPQTRFHPVSKERVDPNTPVATLWFASLASAVVGSYKKALAVVTWNEPVGATSRPRTNPCNYERTDLLR